MATEISGLSNSTPLLEQRLKLEINFLLEFVLLCPRILFIIIIELWLIGGQIIENAVFPAILQHMHAR